MYCKPLYSNVQSPNYSFRAECTKRPLGLPKLLKVTRSAISLKCHTCHATMIKRTPQRPLWLKCQAAQSITYSDEDHIKTTNVLSEDIKQDRTLLVTWLRFRALIFYTFALILSCPLFLLMLLLFPFVIAFDSHRRCLLSHINTLWAKISSFPFYSVKVRGMENLPSGKDAVVYVSNHQSHLDIFALFFIDRPFKYISKTSNFLIPFVGWSMFLTGHVMLNRMERKSQMKCLQQCQSLLAKDASVLFFPEGTRSPDKRLQEFKKGAFSVAVKSGAPVLPVTMWGTGDLMPNGKEMQLHYGDINITIHPRIESRGKNALELRDDCQKVIASALPAEYRT